MQGGSRHARRICACGWWLAAARESDAPSMRGPSLCLVVRLGRRRPATADRGEALGNKVILWFWRPGLARARPGHTPPLLPFWCQQHKLLFGSCSSSCGSTSRDSTSKGKGRTTHKCQPTRGGLRRLTRLPAQGNCNRWSASESSIRHRYVSRRRRRSWSSWWWWWRPWWLLERKRVLSAAASCLTTRAPRRVGDAVTPVSRCNKLQLLLDQTSVGGPV